MKTNDLASVDETTVLTHAQEFRLEAYRAGRSPEMLQSRALLGSAMASLPEGGVDMDMLPEIVTMTTARASAVSRWQCLEGMTSKRYLDHLIHCGALQASAAQRYVRPISSFRQFLIEEGERKGAVSSASFGDNP